MSSSSPPSAPEIEVPDPTPPQIYQAVIPEEDFQKGEEYIDELKRDRANISYKTAVMVGTDEEIGQRYKERLAKIQSAYLSSLPKKETIPGQGIIDDAKAARQTVCQIANRRSDQANLTRPTECGEGEVGVKTPPAPKTQAPQKPAARPAPAPRPTAAPAPKQVAKKQSKKEEPKLPSWLKSSGCEEQRRKYGDKYVEVRGCRTEQGSGEVRMAMRGIKT